MSTEQLKEHASAAIQKAAGVSQKQKTIATLSIVKSLIDKDEVKKRFSDILGKKSAQFLASITSLISSSTNFDGVDPNTILSSALVAATLDLPINPNLGFAYIIPYNSQQGKKAQFQMGYKGFIQLGLRSGQFQTINATEVYEGEVVSLNRLTGELLLDEGKKKSQTVVGYAAYFRLINGFEKTLYMTVEQITDHGRRFSKSFNNDNGLWKKDFHSMAMKTVIKLLLSKYGILSVDMQKAVEVDQGVIKDDGSVEYVDTINENAEKSGIKKEVFLREISESANSESLGITWMEIQKQFSNGELTETDNEELLNAIDKRNAELSKPSAKNGPEKPKADTKPEPKQQPETGTKSVDDLIKEEADKKGVQLIPFTMTVFKMVDEHEAELGKLNDYQKAKLLDSLKKVTSGKKNGSGNGGSHGK